MRNSTYSGQLTALWGLKAIQYDTQFRLRKTIVFYRDKSTRQLERNACSY
jgi:hypothetical protein